MTDLFTTPPTGYTRAEWDAYLDDQEHLGRDLADQYERDLDALAEAGRIPNWQEIADVLQKDELRLLRTIEEHAGYVERVDHHVERTVDDTGLIPVETVRVVADPVITADTGFIAHANAAATINRCLANRWIARVPDECTGLTRLELTMRGRWVMDLHERDQWFEQEEQ